MFGRKRLREAQEEARYWELLASIWHTEATEAKENFFRETAKNSALRAEAAGLRAQLAFTATPDFQTPAETNVSSFADGDDVIIQYTHDNSVEI